MLHDWPRPKDVSPARKPNSSGALSASSRGASTRATCKPLRQRRSAFQSRSYAWYHLSALGLLHAELDGERCRCGKVRRSCPEAVLVDGVHGLRAWEARQVKEARAGHRHHLPDGHPALVDHRWLSTADPEY